MSEAPAACRNGSPQDGPAGGWFADGTHHFWLRVWFEETDLSGVVYHANYLRWFERARSDMLRLLDIDQRAAQAAGLGTWAVVEADLRFRRPARLGDAVRVDSVTLQVAPASARLLQRAFSEGTLLCEMTVRLGFVAPDGRPRRQPEPWLAAMRTLVADPATAPSV